MPSDKKTTKKNGKQQTAQIEIGDAGESRLAGARIPIQILVDYKSGGSYLFDFCKDIGSGGVFIETESPKPMGTELELTFTIPDNKATINTKGKVIWVQEKVAGRSDLVTGMGVQFIAFKTSHKDQLEAFVQRYTVQQKAG